MAKLTTITDRETGETRYPITSTKAVFDERGVDLDTLLAEQKRETGNALKGYATATELTEGLATKQGNLSTTTDLQLTDDNILGLTDMAKKRLFIDLWNNACGTYGRYNESTGYFELNGLTDIAYEEAIVIYNDSISARTTTYLNAAFDGSRMRTNLPFVSSTGSEIGYQMGSAFRLSAVEVVNLAYQYNRPTRIISSGSWIFQASKLRVVMGLIQFVGQAPWYNGFSAALEEIQVYGLDKSITFQSCPRLSLASFEYMIANAANTTAITITVHPDVYAKLTDETNEEWHKVLTDAADKNINFATI